VAPDGRYWIQARGDAGVGSTEYPRFFECMKAQFQAHPFRDWLKAHNREAAEAPLDRAKGELARDGVEATQQRFN